MYKKLTLVFLFSAFALLASAQEFQAKIITGMAASQIDGDALRGFNKPGGIIGAATNFLVGENVRFQQEILYYPRGSRTSSDQQKAGIFTEFRLKYLDLNLVFNIYMQDKYFFQLGGTMGTLLSAKRDVFNAGFEDVTDEYFRSDIAPAFGLGVQLTPQWSFNVRYLRSIKSVNKNQGFINSSLNFTVRGIISGLAE